MQACQVALELHCPRVENMLVKFFHASITEIDVAT